MNDLRIRLQRSTLPTIAVIATLLLTLPLHFGCNGTETSSVAAPVRFSKGVDQIHSWMCGSFESDMPVGRNSDTLRVVLNACPIWPDREDGRWLYAERTAVGASSRSDDQHIHRIRNDAQGTLLVEVFSFLPGAAPPTGSWRTPDALDRIDPALLVPREGCAIYLATARQGFAGETRGNGCDADGTTHRMMRMSITPDSITLTDRVLDSSGKPVAATPVAPTTFRRTSPAL